MNDHFTVMEEIKAHQKEIKLKQRTINGESYFMISNSDMMRPFFMSVVSDSDHWMFISSNGGLSAGRKDSDNALFPYYTDDKITESYDSTGSKSIFHVKKGDKWQTWEPFSERFSSTYSYSRNVYKNVYGNKILFEEINHDFGLIFRYQWSSSDTYGFVKTSYLLNENESPVDIKLLDGIQNIMPYGVNTDLQAIRSNLVDAYKRNELNADTGLGIFALSAIIVDRAEPSEALKANVVWSLGLENPIYLLSSLQLDTFRKGEAVQQEVDVKAERGAYFVSEEITLGAKASKQWMFVVNVNQGPSKVAMISKTLKEHSDLVAKVETDVALGTQNLMRLVSSSDGFQLTADKRRNARHYSNTLFNIMRGGIFDDNYQIEKRDFVNYISKANRKVYRANESLLTYLPVTFTLQTLRTLAYKNEDKNFKRLALEYMPLKFSRRHGDPSRPWNKFSINTKNELDGSKILDYEGNWRDIFQNWEALALAYPEFIESMIHKFLNATTFDGYNPYRVTKDGFDWEIIEEHDPWSYIGYWGDHQIIYLLKFLEIIQNHYPSKLIEFFNKDLFVYANVPYKIKPYEEILKNPKDTIAFDYELDRKIRNKREEFGADGALLRDENYFIHKVNFVEKILATVLAKLSNFIPEAGIWLNTQRPEWNDANNALVGNGVSMVTLYYLRRFLKFFDKILDRSDEKEVEISKELSVFFTDMHNTFKANSSLLGNSIDDTNRKIILDGLGIAASNYRDQIYTKAFSGRKDTIALNELKEFIATSLHYLEHAIKANKRADGMYHAYNLMTVKNDKEIAVSYLDEMLEGQVAVLSSGYLSASESLALLDAMKHSALFRPDQYSYLLYPNKELPPFTEKNNIPKYQIENLKLLAQLITDGNTEIIEKDIKGNFHFNGNFNNAESLKLALSQLSSAYDKLKLEDEAAVLQLFEDVFNHKAFTGRSGTFYGYEGLGSIYWHMVSKLLLAVEECCLKAVRANENSEIIGRLLEHFYEINEGIGVHKSPKLYGAFPTDPYSHTPFGKGVQQPGMTGQVKEDILSRVGELGAFVKNGKLFFNPCLLRADEFLKTPQVFKYVNINQQQESIELYENTLAFTYCQVPVVYHIAGKNAIDIVDRKGRSTKIDNLTLDSETSKEIFQRTGAVHRIDVYITQEQLK